MDEFDQQRFIETVQLIDMMVVSPYLIYMSTRAVSQQQRNILTWVSIGFFIFNAYHYVRNYERMA